MSSNVNDLMKHANFGEDRLRGFGIVSGRILVFSSHLLRRHHIRQRDLTELTKNQLITRPLFTDILNNLKAL